MARKPEIPPSGGVAAKRDTRSTVARLPLRGTFVGRGGEMARAAAAVERALAGRGGVLLIAGDAGIGKTRMAEELAEQARALGARPLWARCHEAAGAPAYWPWVQILRQIGRDLPARTLAAALGESAADLAQLVPEIRQRLTRVPPAGPLEPEQARFRLFDGATSFLRACSRRRPLALVIDDLQWADTPSLLLLQFLAREVGDDAILVVGTYRDVEIDAGHAFNGVLEELCRARGFVRLALGGLPAEAVRDLAAGLAGRDVTAGFAGALRRRTEGNPFFVEEILRHCAEVGIGIGGSGSDLESMDLPQGVHAVIRRRLERLAPPYRRVLAVAAAIGRDFDTATLEAVLTDASDGGGAGVAAAVDEAVASHLVLRLGGDGERLRFAHGLVREVLYAAQGAGQRASLHRRIGEVLEAMGERGGPARPETAVLAYHFVESTRAGGDGRKAVEYSVRAAREAADALAYEDAAAHLERALEALDDQPGAAAERQAERAEILLSLGEKQMHAGWPQRAQTTLLRAAEAARIGGAPEKLARAALAYETVASDLGGTEPDRSYVHLLEEAAARLGADAGLQRARVLARLAQVPHRSMSRERRLALSAEAVDIARALGNPFALAHALMGRNYALWDSEPPALRRRRADEVVDAAERAGEPALALDGRLQRCFTLVELGERGALDREVHDFRVLAEALRQPRYLWLSLILRTARALFSGEFAEADRLVAETLAVGLRHNQRNAIQVHALQILALRRETGGLDEVEPGLSALAEEYPIAAWRCALALLWAEMGRDDEARQEFERYARRDFDEIPLDPLWLVSIASLAETCAHLGDAARAGRLFEMLAPYADRAVVIGGAVSLGSAARPLGLLAATLGRLDDAVSLLEEGLRFDSAMGAQPAMVRGQASLAAVLRRRRATGDRERAAAIGRAALVTARRLGMTRTAAELAREQKPAADTAPARAEIFRQEGDFWTLAYGDAVVRLRDAKGLHYLSLLLRQPGRELHVTDLVAAAGLSGLADTGALLDEPAKAAYRRRLGSLRAEIEESERFNDIGRAARLRGELGAIEEQLRTALGAGGRDRRSGSYAERARLAVTQCVKASLRKIRSQHPALGHHLSTSVRTGYFCVYDPGPGGPEEWLL